MISIIIPYWKRPQTAFHCLELYEKHYLGKLEFEVVIADDGSHDFESDKEWVKIIRLTKKEIPKNPCVPINAGVKEARGDVIVLTGADIFHNSPVLSQMLEELQSIGPNGYVLAACWYERNKEWHCHSSITSGGYHNSTRQPKGSGFHFCAMLNRSLWDKAGGFDEEYRDGAFYDDPDWVNRLNSVGAVFRIRDDLVVEHSRDNCYTDWPSESANRNKALFERKWGC